jgi:hypothetical protein
MLGNVGLLEALLEILLLPQYSTISNCKYNVMRAKPTKITDIAVNRWILFCPKMSAVDIIYVSKAQMIYFIF